MFRVQLSQSKDQFTLASTIQLCIIILWPLVNLKVRLTLSKVQWIEVNFTKLFLTLSISFIYSLIIFSQQLTKFSNFEANFLKPKSKHSQTDQLIKLSLIKSKYLQQVDIAIKPYVKYFSLIEVCHQAIPLWQQIARYLHFQDLMQEQLYVTSLPVLYRLAFMNLLLMCRGL